MARLEILAASHFMKEISDEVPKLREYVNADKLAMEAEITYTFHGTGLVDVDALVTLVPEHPISKLRTLPCVGA